MNYFSQTRNERDARAPRAAAPEPRLDAAKAPEVLSTLGPGMVITGNIVCAGAVQIFGRVTGEIHASHLVICEGAKVEGKVTVQEAVIQGAFNGTIHGNSVKLQGTAVVDGEIFNKSLTIEESALFEGVSRRLERPIDPPSIDRAEPLKAVPAYSADVTVLRAFPSLEAND